MYFAHDSVNWDYNSTIWDEKSKYIKFKEEMNQYYETVLSYLRVIDNVDSDVSRKSTSCINYEHDIFFVIEKNKEFKLEIQSYEEEVEKYKSEHHNLKTAWLDKLSTTPSEMERFLGSVYMWSYFFIYQHSAWDTGTPDDQQLLSGEIKKRYDVFLLVKRRYKKELQTYFTIETITDDSCIVYVQFFTKHKRNCEDYYMRIRRDMKTGKNELIEMTPRLSTYSQLCQRLLDTNDMPGFLFHVRQSMKAIRGKGNGKMNRKTMA